MSRQPIPPFPLPLTPKDVEPTVDLQHTLREVYDQAGFDLRIDYTQPCIPPLPKADAVWADTLLQQKGLNAS